MFKLAIKITEGSFSMNYLRGKKVFFCGGNESVKAIKTFDQNERQ